VNINLETVLQAVRLAGSATPAFGALLDLVTPILSDADQATLKAVYETEKKSSDALHDAIQ
jgi:hypothetical protein